ncbi:hypothetical protein PUN28_003624 [Cardiocondyla obscurior]|uniref:Uncharacterized protein n=1 Tax=Cardiocondyla obscurior TaxID=286306 RepID=A0AAW2GLV0_9HYME
MIGGDYNARTCLEGGRRLREENKIEKRNSKNRKINEERRKLCRMEGEHSDRLRDGEQEDEKEDNKSKNRRGDRLESSVTHVEVRGKRS